MNKLARLGKCDSLKEMIELTKLSNATSLSFHFHEDGLEITAADPCWSGIISLKLKKEDFEEYYFSGKHLVFNIQNNLTYDSSSPYLTISYTENRLCFSFEVNGYNVNIELPSIGIECIICPEITPMYIVKNYRMVHSYLCKGDKIVFESKNGETTLSTVLNEKKVSVCLHQFIKTEVDFRSLYKTDYITNMIATKNNIDAFFVPCHPMALDFKVEKGTLRYILAPLKI
jgi:hypothetical protein